MPRLTLATLLFCLAALCTVLPTVAADDAPAKRPLYLWVDFDQWQVPGLFGWQSGVNWSGNRFEFPIGASYEVKGSLGWSFTLQVPATGAPTISRVQAGAWLARPPAVRFLDLKSEWMRGPGVRVDLPPLTTCTLDIPREYGAWRLPAWEPRLGRDSVRLPAGAYPLTGDRGWSLTLVVQPEGLAVREVHGGIFDLSEENIQTQGLALSFPAAMTYRVQFDLPPALGRWSIPGWTAALPGYQTVSLRPGRYTVQGELGWSFDLEMTGDGVTVHDFTPGPLTAAPEVTADGKTVRVTCWALHRLLAQVPAGTRDWQLAGSPLFREEPERLLALPAGKYTLAGTGASFPLAALAEAAPQTVGVGVSADGATALLATLPAGQLAAGSESTPTCRVLGKPLAVTTVAAWLAPYPAGGTPLPAFWTGELTDGRLRLPACTPGLYRLRIAAAAAGAPTFDTPDLRADLLVDVLPAGAWKRLDLTLARNRRWFTTGDALEFNLQLRGDGYDGPVTLSLVDGDRVVPLWQGKAAGNGPFTFNGTLDTGRLAPGTLRLRAEAAGETAETAFTLQPAEPASHFPIHAYGNALGKPAMVQELQALGITTLNNQGNNPGLLRPRLNEEEAIAAGLLGRSQVAPPFEQLCPPTPYQRWLETLVEHRQTLIAQYSSAHMFFHYNTCPLDPQVARGVGRGVQLLAQAARNFQPYGVVNLGDEECTHWAAPEARDLTCPYCAQVFTDRYGYPPPSDQQNPEAWDAFVRFQQAMRPALHQVVRAMVKPIRPELQLTSQNHAIGLFMWGGYPPEQFKYLDISTAHNYSDFQGSTLWAAYADALVGMAPKPTPYQPLLWSVWPSDVTRHELWLSTLFGIDGVGHFTMDAALKQPELTADHDLLKRFGDLLLTVERPTPAVTVLYSFTEYERDLCPPVNFWRYTQRTAGQLYLLLRAGYDADLISEESILAGGLSRRKVLFLNALTRLRPEVREKILDFQRAGGVVFTDSETTERFPGAIPTGYNLGEFYARTFAIEQSPERLFDDLPALGRWVEPTARLLAPFVTPPCRKSDPRLIVTAQRNGDAGYLFLLNDHQVPQAERQTPNIPQYLPLETAITLDKPAGAVYDLFTGQPLIPEQTAQGWRLPVTLPAAALKVICLLPRPLADLRVSAAVAEKENLLAVQCGAIGLDGKILKAAIPLELTVLDPAGRERAHLFRSTNAGTFTARLPLGLNDPAGLYTVRVATPLGKITTEVSVKYQPAALPAVAMAGEVIVYEAQAIRAFARRQPAALIAIGRPQQEPLAHRLAAMLREYGLTAEIAYDTELLGRRFDRQVGYGLYRSTVGVEYGLPDWQIDHPLIVLGTPQENRLVAEASWFAESAPHLVSPDWPGSGRGTLQYLWGAFSLSHDTLLISGSDPAGVEKAVKRLEEVIRYGK